MTEGEAANEAAPVPWIPVSIGLFLALVATTVFWFPSVAGTVLPRDILWRNLFSQFADWFFAIALMLIVVVGERQPISSMGFKRPDSETLLGAFGLVGFFFLGLIAWKFAVDPWIPSISLPTGKPATGTLPKNFFYWFAPIALVTAAFAEEIIYRGYAMERLLKYFKNPLPAIVLPHTAFALMHLKDGFANALMVFAVGMLFTWFYFSSRNLTLLIIAHFIIDALAVIAELFMG